MTILAGPAQPVYITNGPPVGGASLPVILVGPDGATPIATVDVSTLVAKAGDTMTGPLAINKNSTTEALTLTAPDPTDVAYDSTILAALRVAPPPTPWTRNFLAGIAVVTSSGTVDKGRGIIVQNNASKSDAIWANNRGGGVAFATDIEDAGTPTGNSYGFIGRVYSGTSVGMLLDTTNPLAAGPTLAQINHYGTSAGVGLSIGMAGNAAHTGIIIRNQGGNTSAKALIIKRASDANVLTFTNETSFLNQLSDSSSITPTLQIENTANSGAAILNVFGKTAGGVAIQGRLDIGVGGSVRMFTTSNHALIFLQNSVEIFRLETDSTLKMADGKNISLGTTTGTQIGTGTTQKIGFYGATPVVKPSASGSRGANAALASLLTQLASLGLIVDGTSA